MFSLLRTTVKAALVAAIVFAAALECAGQKINPANQVNWPTGSAGCVYAPGTNTCVAPSGSINVNGSAVTGGTPNLSDTTPAPSSGQTPVTWAKDGSGNVSGQVSVSSNYNAPTTQYIWIGDSRLIVHGVSASNDSIKAVTGISCNTTTCTWTSTFNPTVGQDVLGYDAIAPSCAFGVAWKVLTSSSTSFTTSSHSQGGLVDCSSTSGAGGYFWYGDFSLPELSGAQPYLLNHGTTINMGLGGDTLVNEDANFTTRYAPAISACVSGGGPCYVYIQTAANDEICAISSGCATWASLASHFYSLWSKIHALGAQVIQTSTICTVGMNSAFGMAYNNCQAANQKMATQTIGVAPGSGQYIDSYVDINEAITFPNSVNTDGLHLSNAGTMAAAAMINNGQAFHGSNGYNYASINGNLFLGPNSYMDTSSGNYWGWIVPASGVPAMMWNGSPIYSLLHTGGNQYISIQGGTGSQNTQFGWNHGSYVGGAWWTTFPDVMMGSQTSGILDLNGGTIGDRLGVWAFKQWLITAVSSDLTCASSQYFAFANSTTHTIRLCQNGTLSDAGGGGGGTLDANTVATPQYAVGGGTANAQTVTLSPAVSSMSAGMHVRWKPSNSNTGAATLAVNGLTATSITKCGTTALASGDLTSGVVADATYDGTQFQLQNPNATACAGGSPGVTSIDSQTGAFTFGGAGVSHTGNSYTFSGSGGSSGFPFKILQQAVWIGGSSTTWTYTFPHALQSSGATGLLIFGVDASGSFTGPTGWTCSINVSSGTNYPRLVVCLKASAGDTSISFSTANAATPSFRFYELSGSRSFDVSSTGFAGSGGTVDFPAITPTTGAAVFAAATAVNPNNGTLGQLILGAPGWESIEVDLGTTYMRDLVGGMYMQASDGTSILPPEISLTFAPLSGSGIAYATFSIK
jgi:hypothetical protein